MAIPPITGWRTFAFYARTVMLRHRRTGGAAEDALRGVSRLLHKLATWESDPAATCLSGRPLHRLGSGQRIAEVTVLSACAPIRVQAGAGSQPVRHPGAEDGGPEPLRFPAHLISNQGPPPWRFHLPKRRTEILSPIPLGTARFPAGAGHPPGSSSMSGERTTRTPRPAGRALVSSEAQDPA
jgi:hypothetical protein